MTDDPREATIREALCPNYGVEPHGGCSYCANAEDALDALASLARDARKAILAEAVVRAAEGVLEGEVIDRKMGYPLAGESAVYIAIALGLEEALAAFRAEYPADPQEKP